jgi:hypothetical protein
MPMHKNSPLPSANFPYMMGSLMAASWETIFHRTMLMAQGACTVAEYQRMFMEKYVAMEKSTMAMMMGRGQEAAIAPYLRTARANARRLRAKA